MKRKTNQQKLSADVLNEIEPIGEEASYTEQVNPVFIDNKLIEAIGRPKSPQDIRRAIRTTIKYDRKIIENLGETDRWECAGNLGLIYEPLDRDIDAYRKIESVLKFGYVGRGLSDIPDYREMSTRLETMLASAESGNFSVFTNPPRSCNIWGAPGVGKTSLLNKANNNNCPQNNIPP